MRYSRGEVKAERDRAVLAAYEQGLTYAEVGQRFGLCEGTVGLIVRQLGASGRVGAAAWRVENQSRLSEICAAAIRTRLTSARDPSIYVADLEAGLSRKEIAEKHGVTSQAVSDALVRVGIRKKRRAHGR